ncbi:MAG: hypothetical protein ACJAVF_004058 [Paraglaciecola sp.]
MEVLKKNRNHSDNGYYLVEGGTPKMVGQDCIEDW